MEPGTYFDPERPDLFGNSEHAAHAASQIIEGGKNTVACRLDLMATKASEIASDRRVMFVEEIAPAGADRLDGAGARAQLRSAHHEGSSLK